MPGGAPKGSRNAARGTEWRDAIRKAITLFEDPEFDCKRGQALRKIADKVVIAALSGNKDAIQEIGNRLDGKPHQSIDITTVAVIAEDISDDELADIATGGSSRADNETGGQEESTPVH